MASTLPVNWAADLRTKATAAIDAASNAAQKKELKADMSSINDIIKSIKENKCGDAYKFLSFAEDDNYPLMFILRDDIIDLLDVACVDYNSNNNNNNGNYVNESTPKRGGKRSGPKRSSRRGGSRRSTRRGTNKRSTRRGRRQSRRLLY